MTSCMFSKKGKQFTELIVGIDIGSTAIRVAVGQPTMGMDGREEVQIIGLVEVPSEGIQKGAISSIEETVSALSNALEEIERLIGVPIEHAWIGISGIHILSQQSKGVVAVAKSDGEISTEDVDRAIDAAKTVAVPLNYEILHVIPRTFHVDSQTGIQDPVGMTGIRLEVDTQIIYGLTAHMKNITKAVYRTGIDIDDLVLSILATGEIVTTPRQRELGASVVNIGSSTTSIVVYEGGDIVETSVLPLGSEHVTNDISLLLKTTIDIAEKIKMEYGSCVAKDVNKKQKIDLMDFGSERGELVSLYYIAEIIEDRMAEILSQVNQKLAQVHCDGRLPAGVIFSGGGAKIHGLVPLAKEIMQLPASLGYPLFITSGHARVNDVAFTASVGLVAWGSRLYHQGARASRSPLKHAGKVLKSLQGIWKSLMP